MVFDRHEDAETYALTADIPYPLYNVDDDHPGTPPLYGMYGWTKGDEMMLIPDQFDLWLVDPSGKKLPGT